MMIKRWYCIEAAALEMAYDNGVINRYHREEDVTDNLYRWIESASFSSKELDDYEGFLYKLTEEQFNTVCCGESSEMEQELQKAPVGLDDFLDGVFCNIV